MYFQFSAGCDPGKTGAAEHVGGGAATAAGLVQAAAELLQSSRSCRHMQGCVSQGQRSPDPQAGWDFSELASVVLVKLAGSAGSQGSLEALG